MPRIHATHAFLAPTAVRNPVFLARLLFIT
ncbi:hypothetical protein SAMN04488082_102398 [Desulfomicrobium apsheronum]|uniref:Uncharacterized protein n=1 Tax=Desulfomicrobium apsheronum TaxID=52560 RepID=A0A1I3QNF5_9BACT|nr:hypothetical protein SAMN04488082_102398 [Desulfomicrobium apsheronum]